MGYFNQQIDRTKGFSGAMVGVSIPIAFWSKKAKVQSAKLDAEIASAGYDSYQLQLQTQFDNGLQEYFNYKAQVQYYQTKGLVTAEELVKYAGRGYTEGAIGYVEYIRNLDQAIGIRTKYLTILNQYDQSIIELNYLMGIK